VGNRWIESGLRARARALCAAILLLSAHARAQPGGIISGIAVDATDQAPVAGAVITARSPALLGEQSAVTNQAGAFEMTMLPPGTYSLSVKREGFLPFSAEGVAVRGRRVKVHLQILPEPRPPPPPAAPVAVEFDEATMVGPAVVYAPELEYTQEAIERGVQGQMSIRCVITHDGSVRNCRVLKGLPLMNSSVVDALERRRYNPATAQGKPVDVYYTFNVRLTLPR
jgi:TonB family protein